MNQYIAYAKGLGASEEVMGWISTTLARCAKRRPLDQTEAEHVLDYLMSDAAPQRLRRMSYEQARVAAEKWSSANQKKGRDIKESSSDVELIHDFGDGTRIVRLLTKAALQREGFLMSHCVGGYDPNNQDIYIYSYRDKRNMPHATFEVRRSQNEITQIKGKGNGAIHPRYINPILTFLQTIGIKVRPHEMKNLGYLHVAKEMLELVMMVEGAEKKLQTIMGEKYVFWPGAAA